LGVVIHDSTIPQVTDVKEAARVTDDMKSWIFVVGEKGNRRDAVLECGYCGETNIPIHFYEGDGTPKLVDILGIYHYWHCAGKARPAQIPIMLMRPTGEVETLLWSDQPASR
jgi:hypothetical protein